MWQTHTPLGETGLLSNERRVREALEKLSLRTVGDLLEHYPRRHEDRRHFDRFPQGGMETPVCLHVEVADTAKRFGRGRNRSYFEATVVPASGETGLGERLALRWFNAPYIQRQLAAGQRLVVYGRPKESGRKLVIDHPDFEPLEEIDEAALSAHIGRLVPVYPLSAGISQKALRALAFEVLEGLVDEDLPDWLPEDALARPPAVTTPEGSLAAEALAPSRAQAIRAMHFPESLEAREAARRYLALEEYARLQHALLSRRRERETRGGRPHANGSATGELEERLLASLPFAPTGAQRRAFEEIRADLASTSPMMRLLQGDVGAGKTLVAAVASVAAIEAGHDVALMAPTQILAEQHYRTFRDWFEPLGVEVRLKTGARELGGELPLFAAARASGATGGAGNAAVALGGFTVGTHALLHEREGFERGLGLAIVDEQHKFGVEQREALAARGETPDVLLMSATPIPRTLALAFYGDLEVSILDELPPGRGKLVTGIRRTTQVEAATEFLKAQLAEGRQAYVVYPLVEESEKTAAAAATVEFERWKERLADRGGRLSLLHGRLSPEEKDAVMQAFREGVSEVLVTTTVIEVGVDVPNANLMLVFNAERFGLAQLHQLRGRIGRGEHKSYCVLLVDPEVPGAKERLAILEETRDGFRIAEEDLRQRGAGEVLGLRQSGVPDLKFPEYLADAAFVERAREIARRIACVAEGRS